MAHPRMEKFGGKHVNANMPSYQHANMPNVANAHGRVGTPEVQAKQAAGLFGLNEVGGGGGGKGNGGGVWEAWRQLYLAQYFAVQNLRACPSLRTGEVLALLLLAVGIDTVTVLATLRLHNTTREGTVIALYLHQHKHGIGQHDAVVVDRIALCSLLRFAPSLSLLSPLLSSPSHAYCVYCICVSACYVCVLNV